jgi:23S rRNA (pseudouridine1915-N3)-methyltransferase
MLTFTLLAMGKLRDSYFREAVAEYRKRLSPAARLDIIELEEARTPQNPSPAEIEAALDREAVAILAKLPPKAAVVALCIEGSHLSSTELAASIGKLTTGSSQLAFVIGSSHGISNKVKQAAQLRLSMSPRTFPHGLARVMLCEQLYRACSINGGGKYHK